MLRRAAVAVAVAVCAAAALSGCSAGGIGAQAGGETSLRHLSPESVGWLVKWHRWSATATSERPIALDAPPRGAATACATLDREVGAPDDSRLAGVWASSRAECTLLQRLARLSNGDGRLSLLELRAVNGAHDAEQRSVRQVNRLLVMGQTPPVSTDSARATRIDPRYGKVADRIVRWGAASGGEPAKVAVRCYGEADWAPLAAEQRIFSPRFSVDDTIAFVVSRMPDTVFLSPSVCHGLDRLEAGDRPTDEGSRLALGTAVNALAHESVHLTGVVNEAITECRSVQLIVVAAETMGIDTRYAEGMRDAYWKDAYPTLSPAYRTSDCRDGSDLDLDTDRHSFP
jgi:hypothetical protein